MTDTPVDPIARMAEHHRFCQECKHDERDFNWEPCLSCKKHVLHPGRHPAWEPKPAVHETAEETQKTVRLGKFVLALTEALEVPASYTPNEILGKARDVVHQRNLLHQNTKEINEELAALSKHLQDLTESRDALAGELDKRTEDRDHQKEIALQLSRLNYQQSCELTKLRQQLELRNITIRKAKEVLAG